MTVEKKSLSKGVARCEKTNKPLSHAQLERIRAQKEALLAQGAIEENQRIGRVIRHMGYCVWVECEEGVFPCHWRQRMGQIACGDEVLLRLPDASLSDNTAIVEAIYPREHVLYKSDASGRLRPVASHAQQILIVLAHEPPWQSTLLDRYLVAAHHAGLKAAVFVNKTDAIDDEGLRVLRESLNVYGELAYPLFYGSAECGWGLTELCAFLHQHVTVVCGQSGVGKSSLIKALVPQCDVWVRELSKASGLGKHTTTNPTMYHLPEGGDLIDTPGVRSFDIYYLSPEEVTDGFYDVRRYVGNCFFRDCRHDGEEGCALRQAVDEGLLDAGRLQSYLQIVRSCRGK